MSNKGCKRSLIWKSSTEDFKQIVLESGTFKEVIEKIGMLPNTGSYFTLNKRLKEENIDSSHMEIIRANNRHKMILEPIPLKDILRENSNYKSAVLKKRLVASSILEDKCSKCGLFPEWNGEELVLQLDHINGNHTDNRLDNLRILCPNCHTQTETYAGRSTKRKSIYKYSCIECNGPRKCKVSKLCGECRAKARLIPLNIEEAFQLASKFGYSAAGRQFGVSDKTIKKRLTQAGLLAKESIER